MVRRQNPSDVTVEEQKGGNELNPRRSRGFDQSPVVCSSTDLRVKSLLCAVQQCQVVISMCSTTMSNSLSDNCNNCQLISGGEQKLPLPTCLDCDSGSQLLQVQCVLTMFGMCRVLERNRKFQEQTGYTQKARGSTHNCLAKSLGLNQFFAGK